MPRDYTPLMVVECNFILTDERYLSLSSSAKVLYWALWARAFQRRRSVLPPHDINAAALRRCSNLDTRSVSRAVTSLQQKCLIEQLEDGSLKVCGVQKVGSRLRWKDGVTNDPLSDTYAPLNAPPKTDTETKTKNKNKTEECAPVGSGNVCSPVRSSGSESVRLTPQQVTSLERNLIGMLALSGNGNHKTIRTIAEQLGSGVRGDPSEMVESAVREARRIAGDRSINNRGAVFVAWAKSQGVTFNA